MEENTVVETQPEVESTETPEVTEQTSEVAEGQQTEAPAEMFKVKFNHEDKEITMEEAREFAQKGMNYDKVMDKLKAFESDPSILFVQKQAEKYNMTVEDYLKAVAKEEVNSEIAKIAEEKGVSAEVANELYEAAKLKEKSIADAKTAKEKARQEEYIAEFAKKYPDVSSVTQEIWDRFNKGDISLVDAYEQLTMKSKIAELEGELAKYKAREQIDTKNAENAEASTGSVTGNGPSSEKLLSPEEVRKMPEKEVFKNLELIERSMKTWK